MVAESAAGQAGTVASACSSRVGAPTVALLTAELAASMGIMSTSAIPVVTGFASPGTSMDVGPVPSGARERPSASGATAIPARGLMPAGSRLADSTASTAQVRAQPRNR